MQLGRGINLVGQGQLSKSAPFQLLEMFSEKEVVTDELTER